MGGVSGLHSVPGVTQNSSSQLSGPILKEKTSLDQSRNSSRDASGLSQQAPFRRQKPRGNLNRERSFRGIMSRALESNGELVAIVSENTGVQD